MEGFGKAIFVIISLVCLVGAIVIVGFTASRLYDKPKTEQVDSLSSLPYNHVKEKGVLREIDKAEGIKVHEYTKGNRVYTVFTSEYDYINAVREK